MIAFDDCNVVIDSGLNLIQSQITFNENKVTWYNATEYTGRNREYVQLNVAGHIYAFIAIG